MTDSRSIHQVMVVDNHPVMQKLMADLLMKKGLEVIVAEDGLNAVEKLNTCLPDLFFIDLIMPNISGDKLCRIIRNQKRFDNSFIVILSAVAMEKHYCPEDTGADIVLAKGPFDSLAANVDHIIRQVEQDGGLGIKGTILGRENLFERQISKELLESRHHAETTLNHMSEGLLELVENEKIVYANPAASAIANLAEEDMLSTCFADLFEKKHRDFIRIQISRAKTSGREVIFDHELELGGRLTALKIIPVPRQCKRFSFLVMLRDVTREKLAAQQLVKSQKQYLEEKNFLENIFENSADAIAIVDSHGWFTRWNNRATELFGYSFREMKNKKAFEFYSDTRQLEELMSVLRKNGVVRDFEINFRHKNGNIIPCAVSISLLRDSNGKTMGSLSILRDLTDWKKAEEKLKYLSFHDALTGLYNRAFFEEEMARLAHSRHMPLAIILCDINELKLVNDTLGHQKGDQLLQAAAGVLKKAFRASDIIARIGGDEFAVLMPASDTQTVKDSVKRIRKEISALNSRKQGPDLSLSVGYAVEDKLPVDMHDLFKKADDFMYAEKFRKSTASRSAQYMIAKSCECRNSKNFSPDSKKNKPAGESEILAVARAYEVIARKDGHQQAIAEIKHQSGASFEPAAVEAFIKILSAISG